MKCVRPSLKPCREQIVRMRLRIGLTALSALALAGASQAEEPWQLATAVGAPDWLKLSGETRVRYETLDGQFRAGREGSDQLLLFRSLLLAEADFGKVAIGAELQDSRTYLADDGTPLGSSIANPLDILQLYVRVDELPGVFGENSSSQLKVGRQTVSDRF